MKRWKLIDKESWNTILLVVFFTLMALLLFYVLEILRVSRSGPIQNAIRRMDDRPDRGRRGVSLEIKATGECARLGAIR